MIRPLEWDSNFFGIKTGKLDSSELSADDTIKELKSIKSSGYQLVYIFAPHGNETLKKEIHEAGGKLTDEKVTYSVNVTTIKPLASDKICSCMGRVADKDLELLAIESGKYSRFRTDGNIPRDKFEELYILWMKNSLNGTFAKDVFAYEEAGKTLGMVSVDIRKSEGWIGIIAVNEEYRGRSIGKLLMHQAILFCKNNKVEILNVQTQMENKDSCAFYEKIGFRVRGVEDVYHLWNH